MKKIFLGILTSLAVSIAAHADISPNQADAFLLSNPSHKYKQPETQDYTYVESLAKAMFNPDPKVKYYQGYKNFLTLKNMAATGNPYAQYDSGLYMVINRDYFKFPLGEALLNLKAAADHGIPSAKYSLALIYGSQFENLAKLVNKDQKTHDGSIGQLNAAEKNYKMNVTKDEKRFQSLAIQYILESAAQGFGRSFMAACNMYVTGVYLPQDMRKAAKCYQNVIRIYDTPEAYGLLAQIFFSDPAFDTYEYEKRGIEIAKKGIWKNDPYSMAILGKQLIYPKYMPYSNITLGKRLIEGAAENKDKTGIMYLSQYFDHGGRLLKQPSKPYNPDMGMDDSDIIYNQQTPQKNGFSIRKK